MTTRETIHIRMNPQPAEGVTELENIHRVSPSGEEYENDWMEVAQGYETQFWRGPCRPGDVVVSCRPIQTEDGWVWEVEFERRAKSAEEECWPWSRPVIR